ncbi:MAG TPA: DUF4388 domain-containing protein [Candidatus Limnocylindria bacterium]
MSLSGNTRDFPLDVLLRLLADTKKTGELALRGADGEGALGIAQGRVVAAVFGEEPPVPALGAIFDLSGANFEFTPWDQPPPTNLEGDLETLLRQADEHKKWLASVREVIPNDRYRFRLSEAAADQGTVSFTADRWRVVLAVNGQRNVNDIAAHLSVDRNAALDLLAGLVRDRVIETIEPPSEPEPAASQPPPQPAAETAAAWEATPAPEPEPAPEPPPPPAPEAWGAARAEAAPEPAAAAPAPEPAAPAEPAPAETWNAPAPAADAWSTPSTDQWAPAQPAEPEQPAHEETPAAMDDRLAALFGTAPATPSEPAAPPDQWTAPATDQWAPEAADPRLAAMSAPPAPETTAESEAPAAPPNEWTPPPAVEAPQRKGLFGRFRREETAPEPATRTTLVDRSASSRAGLLAAFSNALLTEYNSGHYGKNRIDDRIPSLLMRVDEQADPIDRPLPVVDDRLDVQAMERSQIAESQSVPYLATLVSTIYGDAEKAFGKDRAKRGYKAAQQHVFGADVSALATPDVAGKLPKV